MCHMLRSSWSTYHLQWQRLQPSSNTTHAAAQPHTVTCSTSYVAHVRPRERHVPTPLCGVQYSTCVTRPLQHEWVGPNNRVALQVQSAGCTPVPDAAPALRSGAALQSQRCSSTHPRTRSSSSPTPGRHSATPTCPAQRHSYPPRAAPPQRQRHSGAAP